MDENNQKLKRIDTIIDLKTRSSFHDYVCAFFEGENLTSGQALLLLSITLSDIIANIVLRNENESKAKTSKCDISQN